MDTMGGSGDLPGQAGDDEARNAMAGAVTVARDYRRGNWTLPETMLLIEAKRKVHEERHPGDQGLARWPWVEDYCWRAGCRRSQNQCNDRWDNLMRDYKKVRAYELAGAGAPSYWAMGRVERKERGLPSNLLREIYDAMGEVVGRRMSMGCAGAAFLRASSSLLDVPMHASPLAQVHSRPLPLEHETHGHSATHGSSESPERKRRRPSLDELQQRSGTPTPGTLGHHQEPGHHREDDHDDESSDSDDLSGAIGQCAAILSEALESREAAEERRHREVMAMEERRGRTRQARREAGEQCVVGLASAVNQLAGSILALAAAKHKDKGGPAAPK
ncbi:trihelix transcription factor ASR3-like [Phragmites australis]|uniref:trihelix transcription factor ASR3-like n=1 Tax=Phragmites australis TaxID=29695 RepID=UPI002D78AF01|nr:trihelix transcription factor ASR3-like [Phragmites australis]